MKYIATFFLCSALCGAHANTSSEAEITPECSNRLVANMVPVPKTVAFKESTYRAIASKDHLSLLNVNKCLWTAWATVDGSGYRELMNDFLLTLNSDPHLFFDVASNYDFLHAKFIGSIDQGFIALSKKEVERLNTLRKELIKKLRLEKLRSKLKVREQFVSAVLTALQKSKVHLVN